MFEYAKAEPGGSNVGGLATARWISSAAVQVRHRLSQELRLRRHRQRAHVVVQPAGVVEQLAHGDAVTVRDDAGQPRLDRVVQPQPALADQLQGDGGDERLRDAARPEPAVDRDRPRRTQFGDTAGAPPHAMLVTHLRQRAHRAGGHDLVQPSLQSGAIRIPRCGGGSGRRRDHRQRRRRDRIARCTRFIPTPLSDLPGSSLREEPGAGLRCAPTRTPSVVAAYGR